MKKVIIRTISYQELVDWHSEVLQKLPDEEKMIIICILGGDRLSCCDEAVAAEADGQIISVASIAPKGEGRDGQPAIVGLCILYPNTGEQGGHLLQLCAVTPLARGEENVE